MKNFVVFDFAILVAFCIFLQANPSLSLFQGTEDHEVGVEGGARHRQMGNFFQGMKQGFGHAGLGIGKHFNSLGTMGQNLMQRFGPRMQNRRNDETVLVLQAHTPKTFYSECGRTTRQCFWAKKASAVEQNVAVAEDAEASVNPEVVRTCVSVTHTCVGNTETCVSDGSCDVAMKVTETVDERVSPIPSIQVSHINNCKLDGQSLTDGAKMPQAYVGIGFATYNEAGDALECRKPKVSDFKLIFLWKNSTVDESNGPRICKKVNDTNIFAVTTVDHTLIHNIAYWPVACKLNNLGKEGAFNLKAFMMDHVPTAYSTPFFSPPYDFAANFQPQTSSNGMVITGSVTQ